MKLLFSARLFALLLATFFGWRVQFTQARTGHMAPSFRHTLMPLGVVVTAALALTLGLHARNAAQVRPEELEGMAQARTELYQIGDQEYLAMNSGSVEDLALSIEKIVAKEKVLLKQVAKRANKHAHVDIDIKAGQIGVRGRPGPRGYRGPKGFPGPRGYRGATGEQGPRGDTGPMGIKGVKGEDGSQGPHGNNGNKGAKGPQGPRGRRGREGRRGEEGKLGKNGPNGAPGDMGVMGIPGPAAYEGVRGPPGPPGPPGLAGYAGPPGIGGDMGPPGAKGNDGAPGAQGKQGIPGVAGKSQCGIATTVGKQMCCGSVPASGPDFVDAGANTAYVDVDTRACKFSGEPFYFTSIYGDSHMSTIFTSKNIVNPDKTPDEMSPDKFRVYLRTGGNDGKMNPSWLKSKNYVLKWCGFGTTTKMAPSYAMCCGSSRTKQFQSSGSTSSLNVNTAGCGWKGNTDSGSWTSFGKVTVEPPMYFTSLKDTANGKSSMVRSYAVYNPSPTNFRTYLRPLPGLSVSATDANNFNFDVEWCGVKPVSGSTNGAAGYPCTAPRVIVGNGDQGVQTNNARICCEKTSASGWTADTHSGAFIEKTVDISSCNMNKVRVTLVDVRGDLDTIDHIGGGSAFSVGTDAKKIKVKLWTKGNYKFYDAERYHWHAQYCIIGD